jgi:hypothetical protein
MKFALTADILHVQNGLARLGLRIPLAWAGEPQKPPAPTRRDVPTHPPPVTQPPRTARPISAECAVLPRRAKRDFFKSFPHYLASFFFQKYRSLPATGSVDVTRVANRAFGTTASGPVAFALKEVRNFRGCVSRKKTFAYGRVFFVSADAESGVVTGQGAAPLKDLADTLWKGRVSDNRVGARVGVRPGPCGRAGTFHYFKQVFFPPTVFKLRADRHPHWLAYIVPARRVSPRPRPSARGWSSGTRSSRSCGPARSVIGRRPIGPDENQIDFC